jgi:hypothetical protein
LEVEMRKKLIAPALIIPLAVAESVHFLEPEAAVDTTPSLSSISHTLSFPPHSHADLPIDGQPTSLTSISASGGQHYKEGFRLRIVPLQTGFRLVGEPAFNWWEMGQPIQLMFSFIEDVDHLTARLSSELDLPEVQIAAIRKTALQGSLQEIGGHGVAVRLFWREELERLGMTFRPPV